MLSLTYQLTRAFEERHSVRPNLIYLNPSHFAIFKSDYPDPAVRARILDRLGLEVVIDRDVMHPHVAWSSTAMKRAC